MIYSDFLFIREEFIRDALVVELVDTLVLGTSSASCSGSSPDEGTINRLERIE